MIKWSADLWHERGGRPASVTPKPKPKLFDRTCRVCRKRFRTPWFVKHYCSPEHTAEGERMAARQRKAAKRAALVKKLSRSGAVKSTQKAKMKRRLAKLAMSKLTSQERVAYVLSGGKIRPEHATRHEKVILTPAEVEACFTARRAAKVAEVK